MNDADIYAFNPQPTRPAVAPAALPAAQRRRLWPWLLGALAMLLLVMTAGLGWALVSLLDEARESVQVFSNGEPWDASGSDLAGVLGMATALVTLLGVGGTLLAAFVAVLMVVLIVVPLVLVCVLLAVGLGLGGAVLAAAVVAAVVLSPLWFLGLLLWLLLRRAPQPRPARMAA